MPIALKAYNDGLEPGDAELLATLEQKPYQAFSFSDLMRRTDNLLFAIANALVLQRQLDRLVGKGLVKSKNIGDVLYYVSAKAA
ncbi:MAG: hypothetical protein Q7T26_02485 [Dehalococcoidia bacterium]|nr:hypothetical protein [Dehalococcoidia bacterium]